MRLIAVSLLLFFVAISTPIQSGCGAAPIVPVVVAAILDCTTQDTAAIDAAVAQLEPFVAGATVDWTAFYAKALSFGKELGGCAIATIATDFLGNTVSPAPTGTRNSFSQTLELYRKQELGGKTIHTKRGDV